MSYTTAYWLDCEQVLTHNPDCCPPQEFGRVRSVAFIKKSYIDAILADPSNVTVWQTGIDSGKIVILPMTSGDFDSGKPVKLKGYGRRLSTHPYRDMTLNFSFPYNIQNYNFFNTLDKRTDLIPAFRTSSSLHICNTVADLSTQEIIEDDLETLVGWNVEGIIRSRSLPVKINFSSLASLFACIPGSSGGGIGVMIIGSTFIVD